MVHLNSFLDYFYWEMHEFSITGYIHKFSMAFTHFLTFPITTLCSRCNGHLKTKNSSLFVNLLRHIKHAILLPIQHLMEHLHYICSRYFKNVKLRRHFVERQFYRWQIQSVKKRHFWQVYWF